VAFIVLKFWGLSFYNISSIYYNYHRKLSKKRAIFSLQLPTLHRKKQSNAITAIANSGQKKQSKLSLQLGTLQTPRSWVKAIDSWLLQIPPLKKSLRDKTTTRMNGRNGTEDDVLLKGANFTKSGSRKSSAYRQVLFSHHHCKSYRSSLLTLYCRNKI